jgi:hypothetical protein
MDASYRRISGTRLQPILEAIRPQHSSPPNRQLFLDVLTWKWESCCTTFELPHPEH